jgi:selenocysteine lyase/cysteine desulfurase
MKSETYWSNYRREFPVCERFVYLNHAGVAPTSIRVRDAVSRWLRVRERGILDEEQWVEEAETCRARLRDSSTPLRLRLLGGTHPTAFLWLRARLARGDRAAVATAIEYPSNLPWQYLAKRGGRRYDEALPGAVTLQSVEAALRPMTRLVAVSSAQYARGAVADLKPAMPVRNPVLRTASKPSEPDVDVKKAGIHFRLPTVTSGFRDAGHWGFTSEEVVDACGRCWWAGRYDRRLN